jgi:hypothetical protein
MTLSFYAQADPDYTPKAFGLSNDVIKMEENIYSYNAADQKFDLTDKYTRIFENGLLKEYKSESLAFYVSTETTSYTYNSAGKILKENRKNNSEYGDSDSSVEYEYKNNRLVTKRSINSYSTTTTNYEYDSKGKLFKSTTKNAEGKIEEIEEYSNVVSPNSYTKKTKSFYGEDTNPSSTFMVNYFDGKYSNGSYNSTEYGDTNYSYTYDQYGNILKSYEDDYVTEDNIYEYDTKGNWIKCKSYRDDWLSGEIEEYKFRKVTYKSGAIGDTNLNMNFVNKYPRTLSGTTDSVSTSETSSVKSASNPGCEGNCEDGYGTYYYSDGGVYFGFFKNGLRHGPGNYTFTDGSFYAGNWENNSKEGYAMYSWEDGSVYFGYYKNNLLNGQGVYMNEDKEFKGGIFKDGNFDITYNLTSNGLSTGCISGDCQNGFGQYYYSNEDTYVGFFSNGQLTHGTYVFANGDVYIGEYYNSKRYGMGMYTWKNSSYYLGMYQNETYHGLGYYYNTENESELIGEFSNGSLSKDMSYK